MFRIVYIFWALLPISLLALAFWALIKPYLGVSGKEPTKDYFTQGIFCLIGLAVAIYLDQVILDKFAQSIIFEYLNIQVVSFLLYPAILCAAAYVQKLNDDRKEKNAEKLKAKRNARQRIV